MLGRGRYGSSKQQQLQIKLIRFRKSALDSQLIYDITLDMFNTSDTISKSIQLELVLGWVFNSVNAGTEKLNLESCAMVGTKVVVEVISLI